MSRRTFLVLALLPACALSACRKGDGKAAFDASTARPDVLPTIQNANLPFRYPPALYAEKVQGNVMLRLFVDTNGDVVSDSTKVVETSRVALLDTAAVKGSRELHFVPAKLRGAPVAVSILFPVYFRHPEAPPPAGDTLLHTMPMPSADSATHATRPTTSKK
jgi:TonB family protein